MVYIRRNIWNMSSDDPIVVSYANAIREMRNRDINDPTSWLYQAAIHATKLPNPLSSWNQCRHGSWYFISWHRMYVYFFESIVRQIVIEQGGPTDWALPYWDYNLPGQNSIPLPFRNATLQDGSPNPLYVSERAQGINSGATLPSTITNPAFALSRLFFVGASEFGGGKTDPKYRFWSLTGRLEQTPHNDIHNAVGGPFGWMSDPATAAQDPIFWLHHANIDRLWWVWQNMPQRANPTDPDWLNQPFGFINTSRQPVQITALQIQNIVAQLNYDYDTPSTTGEQLLTPPGIGGPNDIEWPEPWPKLSANRFDRMTLEETMPELLGATNQPLFLAEESAKVRLSIDDRALRHSASLINQGQLKRKVFLDLEDLDAEDNPGSIYSVYLNLPENSPEDMKPAHHIGNVSLFGVERFQNQNDDHLNHTFRISIDITDFLEEQAADHTWQDGENIDITFEKQSLGLPAQSEMSKEAVSEVSTPDTPAIKIGRISLRCE